MLNRQINRCRLFNSKLPAELLAIIVVLIVPFVSTNTPLIAEGNGGYSIDRDDHVETADSAEDEDDTDNKRKLKRVRFDDGDAYWLTPFSVLRHPFQIFDADSRKNDDEAENDSSARCATSDSRGNSTQSQNRGPVPIGGDNRSPLRYGLFWQPSRAVRGQSAKLGAVEQDLNFLVPLLTSDPHSIALFGGVRSDSFNTDAVLKDSGRAFPTQLWNARTGVNYTRRLDNDWTAVANLNVGSASDRPFGEMRNVYFGAMASLTVPRGDRDAWIYSITYSPLSQIPFPVPMISYRWEPSDEFRMNIGLPLQMSYRPSEKWTFDASYIVLTTIHAQTTYHLTDQWRAFSSFDWQNRSWFLSDRTDNKERLFLYDKRLAVGIQSTVLEFLAVEFATGYLFDRFYFTGRNYNDRQHDQVQIANGLFASAQAGLRF